MATKTESAAPAIHQPQETPAPAPAPAPAPSPAPTPAPAPAPAVVETAVAPVVVEKATETTSESVQESSRDLEVAPASDAKDVGETKQEETKADEVPVVVDSRSAEEKALEEFRARVEEAIKNNEFVEPPPKIEAKEEETVTDSKDKDIVVSSAEEEKKAIPETVVVSEEKKDDKAEEIKKEETTAPVKTEGVAVVKEVEPTAPVKTEGVEPTAPVKTEGVSVVKEVEPTVPVKTEEVGVVKAVEPKVEVKDEKIEAKKEEKIEPVIAKEDKIEEAVAVQKTEEKAAGETSAKAEEEVVVKEREEPVIVVDEDIALWGVPLLPSKGDERTDVVLMKFLRARDLKVNEAFTMLKNTVLWRKKFGADTILEEDMGTDMDGVAFMHGVDREGHPVCYNVYGIFHDKDQYQKAFGDEAKREKFLRWRVQVLEKGIKEHLSFAPGGVNSMVQITDLKNSPGLGWNVIRQATKKAVGLLQDNYPEFVSKKIFINVPWWYLALNTMMTPFISLRTKSKFVIARPARVSEVLFKYIAPEYVPVQYGGLSRDNDPDFNPADGGVSELTLKPGVKHTIEIPLTEVGSTLVWEVTMVGWEATYEAEFVPSTEGGYTVLIQKSRKVAPNEEPIRQSYKVGEAGKIVITVENTSSKKKKVLYRSTIKN